MQNRTSAVCSVLTTIDTDSVRETGRHTNSDDLCLMSFWHVDAGSGRAGGDEQGRVQEIQLDLDIAGHGAVMVAHLNLDRTGGKILSETWWMMELKTRRIQVIVSLNTEDGPYCEVEGQTGLEVLCRVSEGQDVRRLHNFDASLLGFNQITAWTGGERKTGSFHESYRWCLDLLMPCHSGNILNGSFTVREGKFQIIFLLWGKNIYFLEQRLVACTSYLILSLSWMLRIWNCLPSVI